MHRWVNGARAIRPGAALPASSGTVGPWDPVQVAFSFDVPVRVESVIQTGRQGLPGRGWFGGTRGHSVSGEGHVATEIVLYRRNAP